jgi:hypothetical protein
MYCRKHWIALALFLVPMLAWSSSPLDGVWKMVPGSYRSSVRISFVVRHGIYQCRSECGISDHGRYRIPADGKFHAVADGRQFDQVAVRVVDPHTLRVRKKKDGSLVQAATFTLEPGGKHADVDVAIHQHGRAFTVHPRLARVSAGPHGSHALSGVWRLQSAKGTTGVSYTIHTEGRVLTFRDSSGPNYRASVGGPPVTVHDDVPDETVSVQRLGPRSLRETFRQHGKLLGTRTITVRKTGDRADVLETQAGSDVTQRWSMAKLDAK